MKLKKQMKYRLAKKSFSAQHDSSDCGPACLLMIMRYYGGDSSIVHLREVSGTSNTGTTMLGMCQAADAVGMFAQGAKADGIDELKQLEQPCILSVVIDKVLEHYVVCFGYENGYFIIGDPAQGINTMSEEKLEEIWTQHCILINPNSGFEKKESIKSRQKKWLQDLIHEDYGILTASLIIGIITTVLGMAMTMFSQKLIDVILPGKDIVKLSVGIGLVFVIALVNLFFTAARGKLLLKQRWDFNNRITKFFFRKIMHLPKMYFDTRKIGDILSRLGDTARIQTVISNIISNSLISVLVVLSYSVFLFFYSWKVGILAIVCSPLFFWIIAKHNKKIMLQQKEIMSSSAQYNSTFINSVNGIADVKSFGRQNEFLEKNFNLYSQCQEKSYNLGKTNLGIGIEAGLTSSIIQTGLLALCSFFVFKENMTIGVLMAIINITNTIFSTVSSLASIIIPIDEAKVAFERMFEFVDTPEDTSGKNLSDDVSMDFKADSISVESMSFSYIGRKELLKNINLRFGKGITSIVGESGCGKSTLCQIIERFYEPKSGRVLLDDVDVNNIPMEQWCEMVSFVPQDIFIYNGTVLENIVFNDSTISMEELATFCDKYGFTSYFNQLPNGLLTLVGEEGVNLSGGQKQMVAFARAIIKQRKVLILDEMTASMDRKTEKFICNLLKDLAKDHIIIFVTHRLETARALGGNIVVIENGEVAVSGSHEELLKTENFYSQYWKTLVE